MLILELRQLHVGYIYCTLNQSTIPLNSRLKKLSLHFTECGKTVGKADYEFLQRSEVLSYHPCLQSIYAI